MNPMRTVGKDVVLPSLGLPPWHEANGRTNDETTTSNVINILLALNFTPSRFKTKSTTAEKTK